MEKYLLEHIKHLENNLKNIKEKEEKLQKIASNLKKLCKPILDVNMVHKDSKEKIQKYINSLINNLSIEHNNKVYHENGYLNKDKFFELMRKVDLQKKVFFIFKLRDSNEVEFSASFILSKFTPFLYIDVTKVIGIIDKDKLKEFENTHFIPYFNNGEYKELKFFVVFYELSIFDEVELKKAMNIFDRFYLKPSMSDKSYVHYSLIENKIIDFELVEKEKIKKEYAYINELKYPEIENLIRKEIRNSKFVLALLDRIDTEIKEIKASKGTIIVVKRILSFIHKYQLDPQIQEMSNLINQELDREEFIR